MTSMLGEGQIAVIDPSGSEPTGTITFTVNLECGGPWYTWVRAYDNDTFDSFYAQIDGQPATPGIFEADCSSGGSTWRWSLLSYRTERQQICETTEELWTMNGNDVHALQFSFRESEALARILLTQDPFFTPQ